MARTVGIEEELLLVDPDTGETRFTASYEEHLANQALYRQWLEQHASASPTEGDG